MSIVLDGLELPNDLFWANEFGYAPVTQSIEIAIDGSLIIQEAAQLAGRPITLQGGDDFGWLDRAMVQALDARQSQTGLSMALSLRGVAYTVIFRHPGLDAQPVIDYTNPTSTDWYVATIKLLAI